MCRKVITIGSVGSVPHMREIYSYPMNACLPFLLFRTPIARTGTSATWTIMPQSTQIFSGKCLCANLEVSRFVKKILGVFFASKLKKIVNCCKSMNILNNL
jgi:hypothetical protein